MKDRLVEIRKQIGGQKKISQSKFAELLGTTRNAVASYELGKVVPSDTFIQLLCSKFNINEHWLRTGEGNMLIDSDDSLFTAFSEKYGLSKAEQNVARYCLQLTSAQRAEILNHVMNVAGIIKDTESQITPNQPPSTDSDWKKRELAEYAAELDAQEKGLLVSDGGVNSGTKRKKAKMA